MNGYEPSRNRGRVAACANRGTALLDRLRAESASDLCELVRRDNPASHARAVKLREFVDSQALEVSSC